MKELEKFVFFAGKGGVGKTTCSSIYAIKCSNEGMKTLLVSTDPAHSTDKILEAELGSKPKKIDNNLWAKQIDASQEAEEHMKRIKKEIKQVVGPDMVNKLKSYLKLAHNSPGVKESALLDGIIKTMKNSKKFDKVVFDTAPTGETMRLLQLPELLSSWSDSLIERRRENLERLGKVKKDEDIPSKKDPLIQQLEKRNKRLKFGRKVLLKDSSVVPVVTPEKLSMMETWDSIKFLEEMGVSIPGIVLNRVSSKSSDKSENRKNYEKKVIDEINERFNKEIIGKIPMRDEEIIGLDELKKHIKYIKIL